MYNTVGVVDSTRRGISATTEARADTVVRHHGIRDKFVGAWRACVITAAAPYLFMGGADHLPSAFDAQGPHMLGCRRFAHEKLQGAVN